MLKNFIASINEIYPKLAQILPQLSVKGTIFLVILIDNLTCDDAVDGLCVGDQKAVTPDWPAAIDVLGDPDSSVKGE